MNSKFFVKQSNLRKWFEKYADVETELIIGYYKVASGKPSITWSQQWMKNYVWLVDGVRNSIDKDSYCISLYSTKIKQHFERCKH